MDEFYEQQEDVIEKARALSVDEFGAQSLPERGEFGAWIAAEVASKAGEGHGTYDSRNKGLFKYPPHMALESDTAKEALWRHVYMEQLADQVFDGAAFNVEDSMKLRGSGVYFYSLTKDGLPVLDEEGGESMQSLSSRSAGLQRASDIERRGLNGGSGEVIDSVYSDIEELGSGRYAYTDPNTGEERTLPAKAIGYRVVNESRDIDTRGDITLVFTQGSNEPYGRWLEVGGGRGTDYLVKPKR